MEYWLSWTPATEDVDLDFIDFDLTWLQTRDSNGFKSTSTDQFRSKFCPEGFQSRISLIRHSAIHFRNRKKKKCSLCDASFLSSSGLDYHLLARHTFKCQQCGAKFGNASTLKTYIQSALCQERSFECNICGKGKCYNQGQLWCDQKNQNSWHTKSVFLSPTHSVWKLQKKSHSTLRAKRATFLLWVDKNSLKMPKMVQFGEFLKT